MNKLKYIKGGGVSCPECGSEDITGRSFEYDTPCTQEVECNSCGFEWMDILRPVDICGAGDQIGNEIEPSILPLHEIFGYCWVGIISGIEMTMHGPFVEDKVYQAIHILIQSGEDDDPPEIGNVYILRMSILGEMEPSEVPMDNGMLACIECGNGFNDNPEKGVCKTCENKG